MILDNNHNYEDTNPFTPEDKNEIPAFDQSEVMEEDMTSVQSTDAEDSDSFSTTSTADATDTPYSELTTENYTEDTSSSDTTDASDDKAEDSSDNTQTAFGAGGYFYAENVQQPKAKKPFPVWAACLITGACTFIAAVFVILCLMPFLSGKPGASIITQSASEYRSGSTVSAVEIAQKVSPSVVGITNKGISSNNYFNLNIPVEQGYGSGIIISTDGYVVTNNHVINGASEVIVTLTDGTEYTAEVVGTDSQTDLAVLKIEATDLDAATLGSSSNLLVGEQVIAIGNPLGQQFSGSVTLGIVSALNRTMTIDEATYKLIQTDAAINEGNSGGALVNSVGEVIGINSVKVSGSGVEGLGFAIPIDEAKPIIQDLIDHGYVRGRPSIGVEIIELTKSIAYYYDLPSSYGLYVVKPVKDGGADKAGIRANDIIIGCNGKKVETLEELNEIKNEFSAGDTITLTILRNKQEMNIDVVLTESAPVKEEQEQPENAQPQEQAPISPTPRTNEPRESFDLDDMMNFFFGY